MNSNSTVRDLTYQRVAELNAVYSKIISEHTFTTFQMAYIPPDFQLLINQWEKDGGQAKDLIEPIDGFHPSQPANELLATFMFNWLVANFTGSVGDANPNNQDIIEQFGAGLNGY